MPQIKDTNTTIDTSSYINQKESNMTNFFVVDAINKAKAARVPGANKVKVKCFDKVKDKTLEKLDMSILEFEGRYGEDADPFDNAKPSKNWKVLKGVEGRRQDDEGRYVESVESFAERVRSGEEVSVWLKVGISLVPITESGKTHKRFSDLNGALEWLQQQRTLIASVERSESGFGRYFWDLAIKECKPKTGKVATQYNPESDTYEATATPSLKAVQS
jgi:hypothetical protein